MTLRLQHGDAPARAEKMTIDRLTTVLGWREEGVNAAKNAQARMEKLQQVLHGDRYRPAKETSPVARCRESTGARARRRGGSLLHGRYGKTVMQLLFGAKYTLSTLSRRRRGMAGVEGLLSSGRVRLYGLVATIDRLTTWLGWKEEGVAAATRARDGEAPAESVGP